jgi:glycosyltransferase involved in cell wall biosynthesis
MTGSGMPPPARLLDLTRSMSRLGKGPMTGVDRVEAAYLAALLEEETPLFALVKTKLGFLVLDRKGARAVLDLMNGGALPPADLLSRLTCRGDLLRAKAETALRRLAIGRASGFGLAGLLRRHVPRGFSALNTGHSNLGPKMFRSLRAGGAGQIAVLIHDVIPLDHPEFTRKGIGAVFDRKLAAVAAHADLVIHTAKTTRASTEAHLARLGRVPPGVVAPLGIDLATPAQLPRSAVPYFVTIGTIEPRKNHALLLDVWEEMHKRRPEAELPHLLILGHRGWANEALFARLDQSPLLGRCIFERGGETDAVVAGLLAGSCGLLFPSFAEGYGLPPLEARALGKRVIVPPLPIYRETLGDYPVYLSLSDSYSWMETILALSDAARKAAIGEGKKGEGEGQTDKSKTDPGAGAPRWEDHFKIVLSLA